MLPVLNTSVFKNVFETQPEKFNLSLFTSSPRGRSIVLFRVEGVTCCML